MSEIVFKLDVFEGPLDLLVYLVRKKKVGIREIPISQLADEFMDYVERMKKLDINLSADFMATASYLMELKSKSLLPRLSREEREEYEKKKEYLMELVESYKRVKEVVESIEESSVGYRAPVVARPFLKLDPSKISSVLGSVVESFKMKDRVYRIARESLGVEEAMEKILELKLPIEVSEILRMARSRYEMAVFLLAILELIRLGRCEYERGVLK